MTTVKNIQQNGWNMKLKKNLVEKNHKEMKNRKVNNIKALI